MTQFLEINLQDYDLKSDFIKVETPREAICVCCLAKKGSFTYLRSCLHALFLQELIKDKELLICSQCHYFVKKVHNFQMQVKENVKILEKELQGPPGKLTTTEKGLSVRKLPSIDLLPTDVYTAPNIIDVTSISAQIDSKKESKKKDNDNTPITHTSLPTNRKRSFRAPFNRREGLRTKKQATNEKPAQPAIATLTTDVLTTQKQESVTQTPNGNVSTNQKQAQSTETNEKCSLQLSSLFFKNLLEKKQNVGRLLTSPTEFKKNEDQSECAKSFKEESLDESTNDSTTEGDFTEDKQKSGSDSDTNTSEPEIKTMKKGVK